MASVILSEKELGKLSTILEIPVEKLEKLYRAGALNTSGIRGMLIKSDYERLTKEYKQYSKTQIISAIQKEYGISRSMVEMLIYNKQINPICKCSVCGKEITRYKFSKNKGICDECLIPQIPL